MPRLDSPLVQSLLPSVMGGKVDINQVAGQALKRGLTATNSTFEVNGLCLNHTKIFLKALMTGKQWALKSKYSVAGSTLIYILRNPCFTGS